MKRAAAGISKMCIRDVMKQRAEKLNTLPSVDVDDKITDVISYMVKNNLKQIVVKRHGERVGVVTLDELLEVIGLELR